MTYLAQFEEIGGALRFGLQREAEKVARFRAELGFAHQLCGVYPDRADDWRALILEAGRVVQAGVQNGGADWDALLAQAEEILAPIGEVAKTYMLACVSHAHIDMNWMWAWPETVAVVNDTFQTMLTLMEAYPDFIFSQDQASTYQLIEMYNPALFERIRERVREGRWEVTASQWVEGDKNMASGESLSRHLLYTRAYFQEKFGLAPEDVQVDFAPDTFGHPATLPTILSRGGVKYYYHCRGSHGPHLYWWVGPDKARVLVFNDIQWYMHMDQGKVEVNPKVVDPLLEFSQATGLKSMLLLYGVGDHGGGPTRRDVERLIAMNTWPIFPRVKFSSMHDYFRYAEAQAMDPDADVDFPEITGERNFVFPGCYTSQARQKWANRHGENLLFAAEAAATLGDRLAEVPYPHANLETAWRYLLFDQFHDILPGSGVRETRQYTMGHAQETQAAAGMARTNALRALSQRINTASLRQGFAEATERRYKDETESALSLGAGVGNASGIGGESGFSVTQTSDRAFLVFNPLPYPRAEIVEVKVWNTSLDEARLVVTGERVHPQRVQVLEKGRYWGHDYMAVAFPVQVPALGYRVVCVSDRLAELGLVDDDTHLADPWVGMGGAARKHAPHDYTLENAFLKVVLDPASGGLASLVDKRTGREWVPEGGLTGVLQYCVEAYVGMSAWVIGPFLTREDLVDGGSLKKVHDGPYVQTFRWTRRLHQQTPGYPGNETLLELDITVRQGVPRVDFRLRVDWREMGHPEHGVPHLKVRFPLALEDPRPMYEVPYGAIARDLRNGEEVPAQRWADVSEEGDGPGMTLVNTSKYGFGLEHHAAARSCHSERSEESRSFDGAQDDRSFDPKRQRSQDDGCCYSLNMTLLRASVDPDPLPDLGEHIIEYALVPHSTGWTVGDCTREGEGLNEPLTVTSCDFHPGRLPTRLSLVSVVQTNVRLTAFKKSRDGEAIILRLVEMDGEATEAEVTLGPELLPRRTVPVMADLMERPLEDGDEDLHLVGNALHVKVPAYGIVTVRLEGGAA